MRREKNLVRMTRQSQKHPKNQRVQQRGATNTARRMLENQQALKAEMGVLLDVAKSQEAMVSQEEMANLIQMASVLQKVEVLHDKRFQCVTALFIAKMAVS